MKGGSGAAEQAIHEAVAEAECGDGCLRPINKTCVVHFEKATEAIRRMRHAADSRQALDKGEAEPVTVSWSSMVANAEQYLQRVLGDLRSELQSLAKAWSAFAGSRIPNFEALCEEQNVKALLAHAADDPFVAVAPKLAPHFNRLAEVCQEFEMEFETAWAQEASLRVRRFLGTCHVADFLWVSCPSRRLSLQSSRSARGAWCPWAYQCQSSCRTCWRPTSRT